MGTSSTSIAASGEAMQPNTESPHLKMTKAPCEPLVKYEPDAVPQDLKDEVLNLVKENDNQFTTVGEESRQVLYFGEHSYRYTGKEHPAKEMPPVLKKVLTTIQSQL